MRLFRHPTLAVWSVVALALAALVAASLLNPGTAALPPPVPQDAADVEVALELRARLPEAFRLAATDAAALGVLTSELATTARTTGEAREERYGPDDLSRAFLTFAEAAEAASLDAAPAAPTDEPSSVTNLGSDDALVAVARLADAGDLLAAASVPPAAAKRN